MYDLVGDTHGPVAELRLLLAQLGYGRVAHGRYRHPAGRQVIFVGDFTDRGPAIRETLQLVRGLVEGGTKRRAQPRRPVTAGTAWPPSTTGPKPLAGCCSWRLLPLASG